MGARSVGSLAVAVGGLAVVLGACGGRAATPGPDAGPTSTRDLQLEPGDVIRLLFEREPDLSGEYTIDENGLVPLPLLGSRQVTGRPPEELKRELLNDYEGQLRNQTVQITFLRRVRILGEVQSPGIYFVDPTMTLADALALAGGATGRGKLTGIRVLRDGREVRSGLNVSQAVMTEVRSGDQILVPERSWFSRNAAVVIGASLSVVGILLGQIL